MTLYDHAIADGLRRTLPSRKGVDAAHLVRFLDDVAANGLELHGLMLWRGDAVVAEGWRWPYRPDQPRIMHSVAKSFTACAIGMLVDEGKLNVSDRVVSFFPEHRSTAIDPAHAAMTIEDLLTMRTGHGEEVSGAVWRGISTSWIDEFFNIPIVHKPGTTYVYTSAASYMLSAIVSRVTGQRIHDYLKPRLFEPLGIEGEQWDIGPDDINPGGNGVTCKLSDVLKLGVLHVRRGVWEGRRILSEQWVSTATRPHAESYGYHWVAWPDRFMAVGKFVQMVLAFPQDDAVLAIAGAMEGSQSILPLIERHVPDALAGPGSATAEQRLAQRFAACREPPTLPSHVQGRDEILGARQWQVEPNPLGVSRLEFDFSGSGCVFSLTDENGRHQIAMTRDGWFKSATGMPGRSLHHGYDLAQTPVIAGFRWVAADTLEMTWHFVETAFRDTVTVTVRADRLTMDRRVNINSGAREWPTLTASPEAS